MAYFQKSDWSIVYDKAIRKDGSLFFPERLNHSFLEEQRKVLGSYIFFNQYLNEIIPDGEQDFKKEWLKYYQVTPPRVNTFAFIDPAISMSEKADYTALVVVHVDEKNDWYVEVARRERLTATATVELFFTVAEIWNPRIIGVEIVAYQQALLHFLDAEMRRRNRILPVQGLTRGPDKTKEMRIRGLIPRFEWNRLFIKQGLTDFEDEYSKFPKTPHDDLLDALSSIEEITYKPHALRETYREPTPQSPNYERHVIQQYIQRANDALHE